MGGQLLLIKISLATGNKPLQLCTDHVVDLCCWTSAAKQQLTELMFTLS